MMCAESKADTNLLAIRCFPISHISFYLYNWPAASPVGRCWASPLTSGSLPGPQVNQRVQTQEDVSPSRFPMFLPALSPWFASRKKEKKVNLSSLSALSISSLFKEPKKKGYFSNEALRGINVSARLQNCAQQKLYLLWKILIASATFEAFRFKMWGNLGYLPKWALTRR